MKTQKKVLIADDDRDLAEVLAIRCRQLGLDVVIAHDARLALTSICESRPDLICLDVKMPHGSGLSVCEMLVNDEELSSIPVIMLTGKDDHDTIRRCHEMCAFYVQKSANVWERLCPILCEILGIEHDQTDLPESTDATLGTGYQQDYLLRHSLTHLVDVITEETAQGPSAEEPSTADDYPVAATNVDSPIEQPSQWEPAKPFDSEDISEVIDSHDGDSRKKVLYIEDDVETSNALKIRLESLGLEVIQAFDGREGYRLGVTRSPDLVLCDYYLPEGNGDYVLRRFRENPTTEDIPVVFITGQPAGDLERRLYGLGVAGYLTKPVAMDDLIDQLSMVLDISPVLSSAMQPRKP